MPPVLSGHRTGQEAARGRASSPRSRGVATGDCGEDQALLLAGWLCVRRGPGAVRERTKEACRQHTDMSLSR
jgi:hypothetical protein